MDLALIALVFGLIFVVELPDITFLATLVLATRYRPLLVWIGACGAFFLQTLLAVAVGELVSKLPETPVHVLVLAVFTAAGVILIRGAAEAEEEPEEAEEAVNARARGPATGFRVVATSFAVLLLAEMGDLSHLNIAAMTAKHGHPASVFLGAFLALVTVSGLGALLGGALLQRVRLPTIRRIGGIVCLVLAALIALELIGVDLPEWLPV